MRKKINIFYTKFANIKDQKILIGGVQNYILSLWDVFHKDYDVMIYQFSDQTDSSLINGIEIHSYGFNASNLKIGFRRLIKFYNKNFDNNDIYIVISETLGFKLNYKNVIAVQHGIHFDMMDYDSMNSIWRNLLMSKLYKQFQCYKARTNFKKYEKVICVDYNYLNWIRTQLPRALTNKAVVIPNFSEISYLSTEKDFNQLNILFARRFSFERGAELMLQLVPKVLNKYKDVKFTLCGDGPYAEKFKVAFDHIENVTITKFDVGDSIQVNNKYNVVIIPTFGSEGTSFSLLEGMSTGSIPIVSNVGGMTNVIIDNFNGFISDVTLNSFFEKIECLYNLSPREREMISLNSRNTVINSFSKKLWSEKWIKLINEIK